MRELEEGERALNLIEGDLSLRFRKAEEGVLAVEVEDGMERVGGVGERGEKGVGDA